MQWLQRNRKSTSFISTPSRLRSSPAVDDRIDAMLRVLLVCWVPFLPPFCWPRGAVVREVSSAPPPVPLRSGERPSENNGAEVEPVPAGYTGAPELWCGGSAAVKEEMFWGVNSVDSASDSPASAPEESLYPSNPELCEAVLSMYDRSFLRKNKRCRRGSSERPPGKCDSENLYTRFGELIGMLKTRTFVSMCRQYSG